jgi:hypothetical protein
MPFFPEHVLKQEFSCKDPDNHRRLGRAYSVLWQCVYGFQAARSARRCSGYPGGTGDLTLYSATKFLAPLNVARALSNRARRVLPRRKLLNRRLMTAGARRRGREQFNTDATGHLPRLYFFFCPLQFPDIVAKI